MQINELFEAWGRILSGRAPLLSIEVTRECPLRCPGCYAYEDGHVSGANLRSLADFKGDELVARVLAVVDEHKPLHLSLVGGDPLVRYRELDTLLPQLAQRGIYVQVVTSAFRPIPRSWAEIPNLRISVSVDGLQPEHDARRKPATYDKILRNIQGHRVAIHCTITSAMVRPGYLREFVVFWSAHEAVEKIWMSMFTPQRGSDPVECPSSLQRGLAVEELKQLGKEFPKLYMPETMLREFLAPPKSPRQCIFARTTMTLSADLKSRIEPCQFGGDPDCSRCGCAASMGLAAVGNTRLVGPLKARHFLLPSLAVGKAWQRATSRGGKDVGGGGGVDSASEQGDELVKIAS